MTQSVHWFCQFTDSLGSGERFCSVDCSILFLHIVAPIFPFPFEPSRHSSWDYHAFLHLPKMSWASSHFLVRSCTRWGTHTSLHRKRHHLYLRRTPFSRWSYASICKVNAPACHATWCARTAFAGQPWSANTYVCKTVPLEIPVGLSWLRCLHDISVWFWSTHACRFQDRVLPA